MLSFRDGNPERRTTIDDERKILSSSSEGVKHPWKTRLRDGKRVHGRRFDEEEHEAKK
jgi:hypothetical protein